MTLRTLMLKKEDGKTEHNNKENVEILLKSFGKCLNCEDPNKELFQIDTDTPVKTKPECTI